MKTYSRRVYHCKHIQIDEEDSISFEAKKNSFNRIITNKIYSIPIKKSILDIIRQYEGPLFAEMCGSVMLEDIRIYAKYHTIAVKGYSGNEENNTLYMFVNEFYSQVENKNDNTLYISIEDSYDETDETDEAVVNAIINKNRGYDLNVLLLSIALFYFVMYAYIVSKTLFFNFTC